MDDRQSYIGVFDSGIGGLTVARELIKTLPTENIVYLGDTARVPYGIKSRSTVTRFTQEGLNFLTNFKLKSIVIACNTASSYALPSLENKFDIPIFGVISPGVKQSIKSTSNNKIGIIGTKATINSQSYKEKILSHNDNIEVFQKSCPLFVSLAEEGWIDNEITYKVAEKYLEELKKVSIDTLILGCTHYPILKKVIGEVMGEGVNLIDSAEEVARLVKKKLEKSNLLSTGKNEKNRFFVTDEAKRFIDIGNLFFGSELKKVAKIDLESKKIVQRVEV